MRSDDDQEKRGNETGHLPWKGEPQVFNRHQGLDAPARCDPKYPFIGVTPIAHAHMKSN